MRRLISICAVLVVVLIVGVLLFKKTPPPAPAPTPILPVVVDPRHASIGTSVQGRPIDAYTYGTGGTHLVFVGGIHGGYEWNSVLLAYQFMDYVAANPLLIPKNLTVTVIPSANPDGVFAVIKKEGRFTAADVPTDTNIEQAAGLGRFNAKAVDLNRNFGCKWQPESTWRSKKVSAGTEAFSEPESAALRDFVAKQSPDAFVFWHSQASAVYASECENGVLPATLTLMNTYATAANYKAISAFDAYPVTGDAEGWLASINIPAITVELTTHETVEWEKNLAGVKAVLNLYTK